MLWYFECATCGNSSDLFLDEELPGTTPICLTCKSDKMVSKKFIFMYFYKCAACNVTSGLYNENDYKKQKTEKPTCACKTGGPMYLLKPNLKSDSNSLNRRKIPGLFGPEAYETLDSDAEDLEATEVKLRKRLFAEWDKDVPIEVLDPPPEKRKHIAVHRRGYLQKKSARFDPIGPKPERLSKFEVPYKKKKAFRKEFDTKHGKLTDERNPLRTSTQNKNIVTFKEYGKLLNREGEFGGKKFPMLSQSSPMVTNAVRILDRSVCWDYRELGPNSFLRRLCTLLYVLELGSGGDANNPIEVQAMWADGSLYISTNNYSFSALLIKLLKGTTLKSVLGQIKIPKAKKGAKPDKDLYAVARNFSKSKLHLDKLEEYKASFVNETYPDYFKYKWEFVFAQLKNSINITGADELEITKDDGDYFPDWEVGALATGKVYVVTPQSGKGKFTKKDIHAEQLFYPILIKLDKNKRLSVYNPAFIGGVKIACRTCSMVMSAAHDALKDKLILPTDAFGLLWTASAMHIKAPVFPEASISTVWAKYKGEEPKSKKVFATEFPTSPKREEK